MTAVIMAGGKGTRVLQLTQDEIPKPMLPIAGRPILELQIEQLRRYKICNIFIVIGHRGEKISDYFGDGRLFGVHISYIKEELPLGTAGALVYLKNRVQEDFVFLYGDIIFDIDFNRMYSFHIQNGSLATLFVHPNTHPFDSDLVVLDGEDRVVAFDSKENVRDYFYNNCVNAGIFILSPQLMQSMQKPEHLALEKDIIMPLLGKGGVYGYRSSEYVKDVGTPERIHATEADLNAGTVSAKNLGQPQRCIFLDRDGTVNQYRGLISDPSQLELEEGATEAIRRINASKYLCIVITNQPVVARGLCSMEDVHVINKKLISLLGSGGAYLDDIFFCPHHPDRGYPEENRKYKTACQCRKPAIGLLEQAARKYHIDLSASFFVGDTTIDVQTGENAGCKTIQVMTGQYGREQKYATVPTKIVDTLYDAIHWILEGEE